MERNSYLPVRGEIVGGKYEILKEIGRGGMSTVYLVIDTHLHKNWALKVVSDVRSLLSEAEMLKKLNHPCLPRIVDFVEGEHYFGVVMDYIEGRTLAEILREEGAQDQENVIAWAKQLAGVLHYLHHLDPPVIYRDMKPDNIMLKPDGTVALFDFGIAREYKYENICDTQSLGTLGYAAPEQFGGAGQTTPQTDIFSLGVTMYHLVTGRDPSEPPYGVHPIRQIRPELSQGLEEIIFRCTRKNPAERYQDAGELIFALEHYQYMDDAFRKDAKRKIKLFTAALLAGMLGLLVLLAGLIGRHSAARDRYTEMLTQCNDIAIERSMNGIYEQEIMNNYTELINLDPSRPEGYLALLAYCEKTGRTQAGLSAVCARIDSGAGKINRSDEVLLTVAELYFGGNEDDPAFAADYARAAKYYGMADAEAFPEAGYLREIAAAMGSFGTKVDWENVSAALEAFSEYIDTLAPDFERIGKYRLAARIYLANKWAIADTGRDPCQLAEELLNKGLRCVEIMEAEAKDAQGRRSDFQAEDLRRPKEDPAAYLAKCKEELYAELAACAAAGERMKSEEMIRGMGEDSNKG